MSVVLHASHRYIEKHGDGRWVIGRTLPASGKTVHLIQGAIIPDNLAREVYEAMMSVHQPDIFVKSLLDTDSDEIRFERMFPLVTGGRRVTFCAVKLFFEALHPERLDRSRRPRASNNTASIGV